MMDWLIALIVVVGIGGGFAGLAWGWRESLLDAAAKRHYAGEVLIGGVWRSISSPCPFDLESGEYIKISGSVDMDGVYVFRNSEWT